LRRLAYAIKNSSTILLPAWKQQLALLNQPTLMLRRDVKCRWNSTFDMLKRALRLKTAIKSFCAPDHDLHPTDLEKYRLSKREWVIAEQLVEVLKDATLFFSRGVPNLATVIPVMDILDEHLTTTHLPGSKTSKGVPYDIAVRQAHGFAKQVLNKYYALTDSSEAYRIAMGESVA
ncbi:uncharacterized protein BXZ73DRAFT_50825, partial [Epithele typhae]|uniref:uncharacterized protein n=1 Tax=Epithele typhae TaxID=378194 RepID=UPI00200895C4